MIAYFCVEDQLSRAVVVRLLQDLLGQVHLTELQRDLRGFGTIKKKFGEYCRLAQHQYVFILTDLDNEECPPSLRTKWIAGAKQKDPLPDKLIFSVAVTEVEAWLLADQNNLSDYLGLPARLLPDDTQIPDPKEFLLHSVRQHGNRLAKAELLPIGMAAVGLGYNAHLSKFATDIWDFNAAAEHNASLDRAVRKIASTRTAAGGVCRP